MRRPTRTLGLSIVELLVGLGVTGIVLAIAGTLLKRNEDLVGEFGARTDVVDSYYLFVKFVRHNFNLRTQIEPDTGMGLYKGVDFDPAVRGAFSIRSRSLANLETIKNDRYLDDCAAAPNLTLPAIPWPAACADVVDCGSNAFPIIRILSTADYVNNGPERPRTTIPGVKRKSTGNLVGAAFCVLNASNSNISMLVALARKSGDKIVWSIRNAEIWDDTPQQGIEYLK